MVLRTGYNTIMKILVTGGTGFVGSNLTMALIAEGHEVLITGNEAEQKVKGISKLIQPGFLGIDWEAIGNVDAVFHEAALNDTTSLDTREMMRGNLEAGKALFEYAVSHGAKHIVYASSTAVYGDVEPPYKEDGPVHPLNPYGESKLEFDKWVMEFAKKHPETIIVGLRYCNVYGPGEMHKGSRSSMIRQLAMQMVHGNPKLFKDGEQERDYIFIDDVVEANLLALKASESCIVNCGSGSATTFNNIVGILNEVMNTERTIEYIDNPYVDRYQNFTLCDMSLAKEKIGFVPDYDIKKGIEAYAKTGLMTAPLKSL
jgi:ADP-L-glycero-D-manno-heptose 6-epimerase